MGLSDAGRAADVDTEAAHVLSARCIERSFGRRRVLRGLSFELGPGTVLVVTGANGSGKTSLLDILAALTPPDAGELRIRGTDASEDPEAARASVGYLPDAFPLYEELTPLENLRLVAKLRNQSAGLKGLLDSLAKAGLAARAEDPCKELSAGQKRRLALVSATFHEPEVLLMDEPLAAMDSGGRDLVLAILGLRRDRKTGACVVATHDPGALSPVMTHRLALEDGTGEAKRVHVDEAVRSVGRAGAIALAERR